MFAPKLEEWVQLSREIAKSIDPSRPAYDVLLDQYEKGMTMERLDPIFKQVHTRPASAYHLDHLAI